MRRILDKSTAFAKANRRIVPGVAAIAALTAMLAIRAGHDHHLSMQEELSNRMESYGASVAMIRRAEEVAALNKDGLKRIEELEKGLLDADRPTIGAARLEEAFKAFSARRGITVASQKALAQSENNGYIIIPVEFQFRAELPQLKELLFDMKSSRVLMGVRSVRIKSSDRKGDGRLEVALVVEGAMRKPAGRQADEPRS